MEDAPPPDANDLRTRCSEIASAPPIWRVEKMDEDGGYEVTVFSGGDARTRAIRYADRASPRLLLAVRAMRSSSNPTRRAPSRRPGRHWRRRGRRAGAPSSRHAPAKPKM